MNETIRETYIFPEVEIIEIKSQGIVCTSGGTEDYGGPSTPGWFA